MVRAPHSVHQYTGGTKWSTPAKTTSAILKRGSRPSHADDFVQVKFKPISGEDQAGGVVWRAKDANNYYIARANALEDNVTIYDTINGRCVERKRTNIKVATNQVAYLAGGFPGWSLRRHVRWPEGN
jgi:hypothetical protein